MTFCLSFKKLGRSKLLAVAGDSGFGSFGMYWGISAMGMEMVEKSLNWMRYACCSTGWDGSRGMSITVPRRIVCVDGSSRVTRVPGG